MAFEGLKLATRGLNKYLYTILGGSLLLELKHEVPPDPVLIIKAPTLGIQV